MSDGGSSGAPFVPDKIHFGFPLGSRYMSIRGDILIHSLGDSPLKAIGDISVRPDRSISMQPKSSIIMKPPPRFFVDKLTDHAFESLGGWLPRVGSKSAGLAQEAGCATGTT